MNPHPLSARLACIVRHLWQLPDVSTAHKCSVFANTRHLDTTRSAGRDGAARAAR